MNFVRCLVLVMATTALAIAATTVTSSNPAASPVVRPAVGMAAAGDAIERIFPKEVDFYRDWPMRRSRAIGPVEICFAQGTAPEVVSFISKMLYDLSPFDPRYQTGTRWFGVPIGTSISLTWSLVPDGLSIDSGAGEPVSPSNLFSGLDAKFAAQGGRATWINRIQQCFDRWGQVAGITYSRVTFGGNDWDDGAAWGASGSPGLRGDVRISMHFIDGGGGILAYNYFPQFGDMVLDAADNWGSPGNQNRFFRNVLQHEHGHGLGLNHVCPANGLILMEPFANTGFDGVQHDDIRAGQRQYGDLGGNNNTAGTAKVVTLNQPGLTTFPALPPPQTGATPTNTSQFSIDTNGEEDYFRFTITQPRSISVTVNPVGQLYRDCPQDDLCADETCPTFTNSFLQSDLAIDILSTNGTTVLGSSNSLGIGFFETVSNVNLPAAGNYYIRVKEANTPPGLQFYTMSVSVAGPCQSPAITSHAAQTAACGTPWVFQPTLDTGLPPFNWFFPFGDEPAGMTIDLNSGQINWPNPLPRATPYTFWVQCITTCNSFADEKPITLTVSYGDFNGDGVLNASDVPGMADHLLGLDTTRNCAADMNTNGAVDGEDISVFLDSLL